MNGVNVGQVAPPFRLPSGQGRDIGPEDYRGAKNVIVWFTKGMACPFCRQKMSQLARGYPEFQAHDTEILEVTPTPRARARLYVEKFRLPFPYLCDPGYSVRKSWGLDVRSHGPAYYAKAFYHGVTMPKPTTDLDGLKPSLGEFSSLLADEDTGFFILDRQGIVRYATGGPYFDGGFRPIPSNEEILRELGRCERAA